MSQVLNSKKRREIHLSSKTFGELLFGIPKDIYIITIQHQDIRPNKGCVEHDTEHHLLTYQVSIQVYALQHNITLDVAAYVYLNQLTI